jgi:hypothetical protein
MHQSFFGRETAERPGAARKSTIENAIWIQIWNTCSNSDFFRAAISTSRAGQELLSRKLFHVQTNSALSF